MIHVMTASLMLHLASLLTWSVMILSQLLIVSLLLLLSVVQLVHQLVDLLTHLTILY